MSKQATNTTALQAMQDVINELPDAGSTLPVLATPGTAADVLLDKQVIDQDGNVVFGTIPSAAGGLYEVTGEEQTVLTAGTYATSDVQVSAVPNYEEEAF